LDLSNGSTAADALVAQMGWTHPMGLQQERFWVAQSPRGGELGAVPRCPQAPQQAGLGATF